MSRSDAAATPRARRARPLQLMAAVPLAIGDATIVLWRSLAMLVAMLVATVRVALTPGTWVRTVRTELIVHVYDMGVRALPFVLLLGALGGVVLVGQGFTWLDVVGQTELIGRFLVLTVLRETAPFLIALVVLGRSGTTIVAELGSMQASGQTRALDAQGIDPFVFLVVPRVLAMPLATVCLTVFFAATLLASGYVFAVTLEVTTISPYGFMERVLKATSPVTVLGLLLKTLLPGLVMGLICCHRGFGVQRSASEIPRLVTRAFAESALATAAINGVVSALIYF